MLTSPVKILILEDSEQDEKLIRFYLDSSGISYESKLVKTKDDFEEALTGYMPDAILCDHTLPQFDSIRALKMLRMSKRNIPFILVTGSVSEEFAVQMLQAGAHDYIIKDRLARLPSALLNALQKCRIENERLKQFNEVIVSEALFKKAEKIAHFGIWESDLLTNKTKWSDETFRIMGYNVGEVIPSESTFLDRLHPDDKERIIEIIRNHSACSDTVKMEFRVVDKDKSIRHVESEFLVECSESGNPVKITGFDKDITKEKIAADEKKKIVEEFRDTYNKLVFHLENTPLGFIEWDNAFNVKSWSKRAEEIFGWSEEEFITLNKDGYSQIYKEDVPLLKKTGEELLSGEMKRNTVTIRCNTKDGKVIWTEWYNSSQNDKSGQVSSIMSLVHDITSRINDETERSRITSELLRRNKALEQFTFMVSHNLRAPIANMMGVSTILEDKHLDEATMEEMLAINQKSVHRLNDVVKDMNEILNMHKDIEDKKETVMFQSIINEIAEVELSLIENIHMKVVADFTKAESIYSIKSYVYGIFQNLISNSIKYRCDGEGYLNITSNADEKYIYLTFEDNGIGIDMKRFKNKLFGLYSRFHPEKEGKGMGLYMVKSQIEELKGTISVDSEVGKGTKFIIKFIK